ncbi:single-stranded DNA-binding protein [Nocardioides jiangxiensis]|uniref:Single-stranded DNA-binding protein n=1 Tax=Nocardioides jiangxiensis TaxID=3064524 RepID=A0ABT9AWF5_9ACTN|nr:single-stranded DNA-binding protein [Nocardioides sp. WY-20]MDO7866742.1 single-stranded DNA-binding protein [Nocardioides sp. WY-20]
MTNEVRLAGRVSRAPEERLLPSGDRVVSFRLAVPRDTAAARSGSDWVDCAAWSARLRRAVAGWEVGDEVEVTGALRRRVFRAGHRAVPLVEIEIGVARRLVRSGGRA